MGSATANRSKEASVGEEQLHRYASVGDYEAHEQKEQNSRQERLEAPAPAAKYFTPGCTGCSPTCQTLPTA
jgi:hypothetical protein